jgi:uncharacterized protein YndB with AHSA1/START domain
MMTKSDETVLVQVTHRFAASPERVYDAFLNPAIASKFLFATPTGRVVRCEIEARVGGKLVIVDERGAEEVAHIGRFVELERPRRIVFTYAVEKYSTDESKVTIEIVPLRRGAQLTLTHELKAEHAAFRDQTREGWASILEVAGEILVDGEPTCGIGLAQHATIPDKIAVMFEGLAETLELHRKMLVLDDESARAEDEVYRRLAGSWAEIGKLVKKASADMGAHRELPMGAHDESAWGDEHLRAFEKVVTAQRQLLGLLRLAAERDEKMLASMKR